MNVKGKKIVVGMSGGVDSTISLILLKKQGWQTIGATIELPKWEKQANEKAIKKAKKICKKLNVSHFTIPAKKDFKNHIVSYFLKELKNNRTPNPCIICNRDIKFQKLFEFAKKKGIKYVATGHYAKIKLNSKTKKYELLKAKDNKKDQTYFLALLPQKWLKYIVFPLDDYTKKQVYQIATQMGLKKLVRTGESQDFCFLKNKSLPLFLEKTLGRNIGGIIDDKGNILGKHYGTYFYTIGQRKGIGLNKGPYFVKEKNKKKNLVVVTKDKTKISKKEIFLKPFNLISGKTITKKISIKAKIRYSHESAAATLFPLNKAGELKIVFSKPQIAITPGQFCVFYKENTCLGAGMIN